MHKKLGIIVVAIEGLIILALLGVLIFFNPKTVSEDEFRGPTTPPHVNGPKEPPPGQ